MSSVAAVLPVSPTFPQPLDQDPTILTHAMFLDTMQAMREHYKGSPLTTFPLIPGQFPMAVDGGQLQHHAAPAQNGKAQLDKVLATGKAGLSALAKSQQDFVQKQANALHAKAKPSSKDVTDFTAQMNAQRATAKQKADQQIDATFDSLSALGQTNPAMQSALLQAASVFSSTAMALFSALSWFYTNVIAKVISWLPDLKSFLGKVGGEISSVGSTISGILSIF